ncbi:Gfo/Idh/MocA family oxidoreductase [Massilia sp. PAMC28688]|uniref:Gfo/Idh/MocA family protein n=1 Tax=Massilia sp. PAMC28688 TaxID=2861283 RepID=UPI001C635209|nr:Gfo/Idh/MocA family oxidoreductase [Massilia sp. PAMC28688]QYF95490.1 Gfo/Idh/MocA family oxidoreductase [Massilia sp. PAMC28688]
MEQIIRWGIIGTGKIARAFATALKETPQAMLAGVGSRNLDSAQAFCAEFGGAAYASYEALAAAGDIDIIYIATPHPLHAENAMLVLSHGKAVLCEKPFTMNRREAEQVVALARARKLFLMEAMWTRFTPALAAVRQAIADGEIGAVRQLHVDFGFAATTDPLHRLNNRALGGGALLDLGIYPLSIASALLGPIKSVVAQADLGPTGVDLQTAFLLRHDSGAMAVCSCSLVARTPAELTVSGELGHVRMNTMFHRATSITISTDRGARTIPTPYLGNGYVYEAVEAGRCLRAGLLESPAMPQGETLALMGVMDEIRRQIGLHYRSDD